jgi:hypothetical protein
MSIRPAKVMSETWKPTIGRFDGALSESFIPDASTTAALRGPNGGSSTLIGRFHNAR